jgi:hypothetical protein
MNPIKNSFATNGLVLAGSLLTSVLFTYQGFGLNTWLLTVGILLVLRWQKPGLFQHNIFLLAALGLVLTATCWLLIDTYLARFTWMVFAWLLIGVTQAPFLRFVWYAFLLAFSTVVLVPWSGVANGIRSLNIKGRLFTRWGSLLVIPLLLVALFFLLYSRASQTFAGLFGHWHTWLQWLQSISNPGPFFGWAMAGFFFFGALLWPSHFARLAQERDGLWSDVLKRKRPQQARTTSILGLKREYYIALISLASLNGLLLIVNLTDVYTIWLGQAPRTAAALSEYVHEGTGFLILSIMVASLVLLAFFRRNLHFYPDSAWLRRLAYCWIGQNLFLTFSVALRNGLYAHTYGLTYLRIGLFFFLTLVGIGLLSLAGKIRFRYSLYGLIRRNAHAWLVALLAYSMVPWDLTITAYNLQPVRRTELDVRYLIQDMASAKNIVLLQRHRDILLQGTYYSEEQLDTALRQKEKQLTKTWHQKGPLGRTLMDRWLMTQLD